MMDTLIRRTALVLAVLAMAGLALGQAQNGNLYGKVVAEDGSALPGVSVTLSGVGATSAFTSDSRGEFHFVGLAVSSQYNLKCELTGFGSVDQKGIVINLGKNTDLRITMKVAKAEAQVTVTGESPVIDTRKIGTGATVSRQEMDAIPSARDPWVVMQTIPGVEVDRMNVGGNMSGQQSIFHAKGSQTTQGSWNLDGVTVSDMASGASSPTYWDFDSFQEMQAVTGGSDPAIATSGVTLNMVTKRGTNDVRGSARVFITDPKFQAKSTLTQEEIRQSNSGGGTFGGSSIRGVQDYGLEVGGPVIKDKLWLWGSYGRNQIDLLTVLGYPDKTTLEDINAKMNFQAVESNGLTVFYLRADKRKQGRSAATDRPPETSVDQSGPTSLYKLEDNQVFTSSLVADAFYSFMDEGFVLVAEGGSAVQTYRDAGAIWHKSFVSQYFGRPQRQLLGTLNYFLSTGPLGHEFKFGGGFRRSETRSKAIWPGDGGIIAFALGSGACSVQCAAITRNSSSKSKDNYLNFFFGDTITMDRLTASLGIRYDNQKGSVMASLAPQNDLYPALLPAASASAVNNVVSWNDWSPRVGLTYALGEARKTLVRASYARYANQLGAYPASSLSAIPGVAYAYYPWTDTNNNQQVDPGELNTSGAAIKTINFNPAGPSTPNSINANMTSEKTDEIVVGAEQEVLPNFAVGGNYTHRKYTNFYFSYRSFLGSGGAIPTYSLDHMNTGTLPDGTAYSVPVYSICNVTATPGCVPPGSYFTNRPNYDQTFNGVELTFTKRMSSGWMMRGNIAYNSSKQHVGPGACVDPTNGFYSSGEDSVPGGCADGGPVAPNAGGGSGSFGNVNLYAKWLFNVSGAYQLPLGFTVAANYFGRQGYPIAYWVNDTGSTDKLTRRVYVGAIDAYRYGWVSQFDMRLDKNIPITSTVSANLALDAFNLTNLTTVVQRNSRLKLTSTATGTNTVFETQSPRIFRISGRISF